MPPAIMLAVTITMAILGGVFVAGTMFGKHLTAGAPVPDAPPANARLAELVEIIEERRAAEPDGNLSASSPRLRDLVTDFGPDGSIYSRFLTPDERLARLRTELAAEATGKN